MKRYAQELEIHRKEETLTRHPKDVDTARELSPSGEKSFENAVHKATRGLSSATTTQVRTLKKDFERFYEFSQKH